MFKIVTFNCITRLLQNNNVRLSGRGGGGGGMRMLKNSRYDWIAFFPSQQT